MPPLPMPIRIASFTPDLPDFQSPGSPNARNVLPRTRESFGPASSPLRYSQNVSPDLSKACQGAAAYLDPLGNTYQFAGDANDLYEYSIASAAWTKVSKTLGGYSVPSSAQWRFEYFNGILIATDYADAIQSFTLGTSTGFADLANGGVLTLLVTAGGGYTNGTNYALTASGGGGGAGFAGLVDVAGGALTNARITNPGSGFTSLPTINFSAGAGSGGSIAPTIASIAPKARYLAVVRGFLMVAGTNDGSFGQQPQRVWWSGIGNPTNWPTPGTAAAAQAMSSYNDLTGSGGWNQGLVGNLGNADGAIFQEHAVWRVMFAGPPNVFDFLPAEGVKGCPAPGSIAQVGAVVYYLGEDGFYAFDGATSTPIGVDQVDKFFFADLDQTKMGQISAAVDPINKNVFWAYPSVNNNPSGGPNHILCYRWDLQRWSILDVTLEILVRLLSVGYTLDQLGQAPLNYTIDTLPAPLDSRIWTGGKVLLGMFDTNNNLNYFTGPFLAATVDSGEQQLFPGKRAFVSGARPWVDGVTSGVPSVAIGKRERMADAVSFSSAAAMNAFGTCPLRATGRYVRTRTTMPFGAVWSNMIGLELDAEPCGER